MFKTIIGVVGFLVLALILQLYEQNQQRIQIAQQQYAHEAKPGAHEPESPPVMEDFAVGTFRVASGMPKEFRISVDTSKMIDVTVAGRFDVSGKNTGVEAYIFEGDNYTNWLDGNDSVALYDSGRKTTGEIKSHLENSGTYFLIFQNKSSSAALDVHADVRLQFETPHS